MICVLPLCKCVRIFYLSSFLFCFPKCNYGMRQINEHCACLGKSRAKLVITTLSVMEYRLSRLPWSFPRVSRQKNVREGYRYSILTSVKFNPILYGFLVVLLFNNYPEDYFLPLYFGSLLLFKGHGVLGAKVTGNPFNA